MDVWPQRKNFRRIAQGWAKERGINRADLALRLELSEGSLHSLYYDRTRKAGLDLLRRASVLFGCSITEFIGDPGSVPEGMGISPNKWAEASERDRALITLMFEDLKTIPEDMKDKLYQQWLAAIGYAQAFQSKMNERDREKQNKLEG